MQLSGGSASAGQHSAKSGLFSRWFPTPKFLMPLAAGVDISESSIKWLILEQDGPYKRVVDFGDEPLAPGIVSEGAIKNIPALSQTLRDLKKKWKHVECAHAALPEEPAYVFSMHVPSSTKRDQTLRMIEFELEGRVPIPPSAAVYDYDIIEESEGSAEIGVVVFPRDLAQTYVDAFRDSGITLISLEIEARSIARAISSREENEPITLLADFGRARTGFAVLKRGIPIFTSTVEVGGNTINQTLEEKLGFSSKETEELKDFEGLYADGKRPEAIEAIAGTASALADEVAKHYHYWDTRRNEDGERMTPVGRVVLVGGSANLKGLDEYIAGRVQAETIRGNIWQHVCDLADYVPPIDKRTSLQYATAMGLALRSV